MILCRSASVREESGDNSEGDVYLSRSHDIGLTPPQELILRIKDQVIVIIPDTRAAISIINNLLTTQLELPVLSINPVKVQAFNNVTIMIRVINKTLLKI